jgi:hypothetical protein
MITYEGLLQLGFKSSDFKLVDYADGNGVIIDEWNSDSQQPTVAEIEAADAEWHKANDHKITRAAAYPSIQEQLDMQYWDSVNGTTTWADAIAAVKAAHPKGE